MEHGFLTARRFLAFVFCVQTMAFGQMQPIPAATFDMGEDGGVENAAPRHTVALSPYSIDKYEVANAQYDSCVHRGACTPAHYDDGACMLWTGREFKNVRVRGDSRGPRYPVACVTWSQARDYCRGKGKDLPTEAQWEYAALGGRDAMYSWGNQQPEAKRCARPLDNKPRPVGSFAPNPYNLYDMTGNVWEWTNDHYQPDYYSTSEPKDPQGPEVGQYRVIRGGGWYSDAAQLRIKNRHWFDPNFSEVSIGFRCAK